MWHFKRNRQHSLPLKKNGEDPENDIQGSFSKKILIMLFKFCENMYGWKSMWKYMLWYLNNSFRCLHTITKQSLNYFIFQVGKWKCQGTLKVYTCTCFVWRWWLVEWKLRPLRFGYTGLFCLVCLLVLHSQLINFLGCWLFK